MSISVAELLPGDRFQANQGAQAGDALSENETDQARGSVAFRYLRLPRFFS